MRIQTRREWRIYLSHAQRKAQLFNLHPLVTSHKKYNTNDFLTPLRISVGLIFIRWVEQRALPQSIYWIIIYNHVVGVHFTNNWKWSKDAIHFVSFQNSALVETGLIKNFEMQKPSRYDWILTGGGWYASGSRPVGCFQCIWVNFHDSSLGGLTLNVSTVNDKRIVKLFASDQCSNWSIVCHFRDQLVTIKIINSNLSYWISISFSSIFKLDGSHSLIMMSYVTCQEFTHNLKIVAR